MTSEQELLHDLKRGKPEAVRRWFAEYKEPIQQLIASKVSLSADVEELVQQVFINSLRQLPLFRGESQLKTWMLTIARHEVADYYRKKYAKKALQTLPLSELVLAAPLDDAHGVSQKVAHVLSEMEDRSRELLLQKYVDGKQVAVIAQEFGKSVKAIESELFRARNEFKSRWDEAEFEAA